jgi:hypothetical protein
LEEIEFLGGITVSRCRVDNEFDVGVGHCDDAVEDDVADERVVDGLDKALMRCCSAFVPQFREVRALCSDVRDEGPETGGIGESRGRTPKVGDKGTLERVRATVGGGDLSGASVDERLDDEVLAGVACRGGASEQCSPERC